MVLQNAGPTTIGGLSGITNNDIIYYDGTAWSLKFDGSDVGLSVPITAFAMIDANTVIFSIGKADNIPSVGRVTMQDVVRFTGTLGASTSGSFSMYFDGSDVGLDKSVESIYSLERLSTGQLIIGTKGAASVPGVSAALEDMLIFTPTALGSSTTGTWSLYIDGSDIGLNSTTRIDSLAVDAAGDLYFSTNGAFTLGGISGSNEDVIVCTPTSLGVTTACTFHPGLYFDGSAWGLSGDNVEGIGLP